MPLIKKNYNSIDDAFDRVFHGEETQMERYARRREFANKYGEGRFNHWIPGLYAYVNIRETLQKDDLSKRQKATEIGMALTGELALNVIRVGAIYTIYRLHNYLFP
ncbi:hypothetical protein H6503_00445 [Candidatus Woesearchaeota archaeon]|nr:hypothetical protein [Candidatus Woesearchaeota archaeon]